MRAIVFDVDGVIILSANEKTKIIEDILKEYHLYDVPGVPEIIAMSLNRNVLIEKIYHIQQFDKEIVLGEINNRLRNLENNPKQIIPTVEFIKNNHDKYLFFTNTSVPRNSLERILESLEISHCFKRLFTGDDGFKKDNMNFIIKEYGIPPDEILFIDDTLSHIENVSETGVNLLHFPDPSIDLCYEIQKRT